MTVLGEPERIAIGIVHVKLARAPTLINRTFMDFLRSVRIPRRTQPSLPKLGEDCINVIGRNDNRLPEFPVATVAGEEQSIPVTRQRAKGRICEIVIALDTLEIEDAGVEGQRGFHVPAADSWEDCHMPPNTKTQLPFRTKWRDCTQYKRAKELCQTARKSGDHRMT